MWYLRPDFCVQELLVSKAIGEADYINISAKLSLLLAEGDLINAEPLSTTRVLVCVVMDVLLPYKCVVDGQPIRSTK